MACVAILLATYNGERYIEELLESLENQTYHDFHCYIHDDGSTDNTLQIVSRFINNNCKYEIVQGPAMGSAARNFLFLLEKIHNERFVMFCDQDDVWLNNKIELSLELMKKGDARNTPKVVCSDLIVVDNKLKTISDSYFKYENRDAKKTDFNHIIKKNVAPGCAMMINRKMTELLVNNKGLSDIVLHDWTVMILASLLGDVVIYDKGLILYRQHENNVVGAKEKTGIKGVMRQAIQIMTLRKLEYVKSNVKNEKKIVKYILDHFAQVPSIKVELANYYDLFDKHKVIRMKTYTCINRDLGIRRYLRAIFV